MVYPSNVFVFLNLLGGEVFDNKRVTGVCSDCIGIISYSWTYSLSMNSSAGFTPETFLEVCRKAEGIIIAVPAFVVGPIRGSAVVVLTA